MESLQEGSLRFLIDFFINLFINLIRKPNGNSPGGILAISY